METHARQVRNFCGNANCVTVGRMTPQKDTTDLLAAEAASTTKALVAALRSIADRLEATPAHRPTTYVSPDLVMDEQLQAVRDLREALEEHGDDLIALAALARYPMALIGRKAGMSETAVPIRLARTKRLEQYADTKGAGQPRVSSRGLGAATWALQGKLWEEA